MFGLSDPLRRRVAAAAVERRYAARAVLYRAGDPPSALYLVLAGRVRVAREFAEGSTVLHFESAGGVLGEIPVFGGGAYPATATAGEPTRCAVISATFVDRLVREEPEFARFGLARLATRARTLLERLDALSHLTVPARLATFLLTRANLSASTEITLGMTQSALADELGTAREVLVRALRALCDAGALHRIGRAQFAITDRSTLESLAMPDRATRPPAVR